MFLQIILILLVLQNDVPQKNGQKNALSFCPMA